MNLSKRKKKTEGGEKPDYLTEMFKENIKKFYVNLFIKKLKQIIVRDSEFNHPLL